MRTMYKGEIQLTYNEYKNIKNYKPFVKKICEIKGENEEIFYINCTIADAGESIDLKLDLTSKNNTINDKYGYLKKYPAIYCLIGREKISTKDKEGNIIDFIINIDTIYDKKHFPDKTEFYKIGLNVLNWKMKTGNEALLENEICYRSLDDKFDLAWATYSILSNPCNLNKDIKELYLNKLHYVGIEIEDTPSIIVNGRSYPKAKLKIEDSHEIIGNIKSIINKDELLVYMLSLIYLIINKDLNANRSKDKDFITVIGYQLMEKYIELYTLK